MKKRYFYLLILFGLATACQEQNSDHAEKLMPNDFKEIFQVAIDHPLLQEYFHIDADTFRRQVIFQYFGDYNHDELKGVIKFGRQVKIMTETEILQNQVNSYFVVSGMEFSANTVRLRLEYPAEGLLLSYMFNKINGNWLITSFNLAEK